MMVNGNDLDLDDQQPPPIDINDNNDKDINSSQSTDDEQQIEIDGIDIQPPIMYYDEDDNERNKDEQGKEEERERGEEEEEEPNKYLIEKVDEAMSLIKQENGHQEQELVEEEIIITTPVCEDTTDEEFEDITLEDNTVLSDSTPIKKISKSPFKQLLTNKFKSFTIPNHHRDQHQHDSSNLNDGSPISSPIRNNNDKYNTYPSPSMPIQTPNSSKLLNSFLKSGTATSPSTPSSPLTSILSTMSSSPSHVHQQQQQQQQQQNSFFNPSTTHNNALIFHNHPLMMSSNNNHHSIPSSSNINSSTSTTNTTTSTSSLISSASSSMASSPSSTMTFVSQPVIDPSTPSLLSLINQHSKSLADIGQEEGGMRIPPSSSMSYYRSSSMSSITRPVLSSDTTRLSSRILFLLSLSIFFSVSNLYYIQPLLNVVGEDFEEEPSVMAFVTMSVQFGYAFGLLFISILGDIYSKKKLILILSTATSLSLVGVGLSPNVVQMIIFQFIVGATTIIPHIAIPLAVDLTNPNERGGIIGVLMSSLFVGLLGARVLSGILGALIGWRILYFIAASTMMIVSILLFFFLPYNPRNQAPVPYRKLVFSIAQLLYKEPVLRQTCFIGSTVFATFCILWTTLSFRLNDHPYNYSSGFIGLFGLIGMAGAIAAPVAGRLSDRFSINGMIVISLIICVVGYTLLLTLDSHLIGLIAGIFILDLGVQSCHITNQSRNYKLNDSARSRINACYMASYFIGGSIGSGLCGITYDQWGWAGSSIVAMVFLGLAMTCHLMYYKNPANNVSLMIPKLSNSISSTSILNHGHGGASGSGGMIHGKQKSNHTYIELNDVHQNMVDGNHSTLNHQHAIQHDGDEDDEEIHLHSPH